MTVQRRQFLSLVASAAALRPWSGATSFCSTVASPPVCHCKAEAEILRQMFGQRHMLIFHRSNSECIERRLCLSKGEPIRLLRVVPIE